MEDQSKYLARPKLDGNKSELFRIYYNPNAISFDLFLWLEEKAVIDSIIEGLTTFKAFASPSLGPITICKN